MLGAAELPPLAEGVDATLWPGLLTVTGHLPDEYVLIGGVMVFLHGAVAGRQPRRVTRDVDVLCDVELVPSSLVDTVRVLNELGYTVAQDSPDDSTHRYHGPAGELVDVLAPAGVTPPPDLTTTPPGRTIEVYAGRDALRHRVVVHASYAGRTGALLVPDLPRALKLKAAAYSQHKLKAPADAHDSRHLQDVAFLISLITDVDAVLAELGEPPANGRLELAADLDDPRHPSWAAAGEHAQDARLLWDVVRHES